MRLIQTLTLILALFTAITSGWLFFDSLMGDQSSMESSCKNQDLMPELDCYQQLQK